jgi:hypothetical protein
MQTQPETTLSVEVAEPVSEFENPMQERLYGAPDQVAALPASVVFAAHKHKSREESGLGPVPTFVP